MKKVLLITCLLSLFLSLNGQDLASKIPSNAKVVVNIKGKNITDLVSTTEFENSKIGQLFLKELKKETDEKMSSLNDLGIDLRRNFYYFLESDSLGFTNSFLVPLNNKNFLELMPERQQEKIQTEGDFSYFVNTYDHMVTMWSDNTLLLTFKEFTDGYNDYSQIPPPPNTEEENTEDTSSEDYYEKRRKEREAKELERSNLVLAHAKEIISGNYSSRSVLKNASYKKALGKGQDEVVAWVDDFGSIYSDLIGQSLSYGMGPYQQGLFNSLENIYGNMSITAKLNFDETSATIKTDYTMSDAMAKYMSAMYNGKMNSKFFKYFNEDNMLAYFSVNTSTKGILEAYPEMMSDMFENSGENELAVAVPLMMDVLSLLIDEEGAAKILRGDMLFVLTELKEREVTYTTYEYDDDFNRKEVTKTKTETVPDFLMMATSSEKELFKKIMRIAVKESNGAVSINANGIYQIESKEFPIALNFLFKDDTVIMGSSIEHLIAISRGTFKGNVGGKHKKMIAKNSAVIYVNGKSMVTKFPQDMMPREIQSKMDFIAENTEDVVFRTSKVKGNMMQGEMILNTPEEGHNNSLAYFLNMIDAFMD